MYNLLEGCGEKMRVQEVLLDNNKKRYILLDEEGLPVVEAVRYLKYLDSIGRSIFLKYNTINQ